jgi:hypothetical protein
MDLATGLTSEVTRLVRTGVVDPVLQVLRPIVIEPAADTHPALWRQAWMAWQEVRGFGSDLITPPDHYRPNPYWSPPQIRPWAYNRAALLLVADDTVADDTVADERLSAEVDLLLRFLGIR